eukprot:734549-Prorocentrum_lima.AAC.1
MKKCQILVRVSLTWMDPCPCVRMNTFHGTQSSPWPTVVPMQIVAALAASSMRMLPAIHIPCSFPTGIHPES